MSQQELWEKFSKYAPKAGIISINFDLDQVKPDENLDINTSITLNAFPLDSDGVHQISIFYGKLKDISNDAQLMPSLNNIHTTLFPWINPGVLDENPDAIEKIKEVYKKYEPLNFIAHGVLLQKNVVSILLYPIGFDMSDLRNDVAAALDIKPFSYEQWNPLDENGNIQIDFDEIAWINILRYSNQNPIDQDALEFLKTYSNYTFGLIDSWNTKVLSTQHRLLEGAEVLEDIS